MVLNYNFDKMPRIVFGKGRISELPKIAASLGGDALLMTGTHSYKDSGKWDGIVAALEAEGVVYHHIECFGEPSPDTIDGVVEEYRTRNIGVVVAWGGGSVVDAGKAVSAMLRHEGSVLDYLEDVGTKKPSGDKVPFIAVPTTAGTGSEATKNAVLSRVGCDGFKKSLRHDNFVPDVALIDPALMLSCPAAITAACGMDAFTQLLESYISTNASPMTDALAFSGMQFIRDSLVPACSFAACDDIVRSSMAYAALMSGIALANAGLGLVHGFATSIGGFFEIPHGVICGTLVGAVTEETIKKLFREDPESPALKKYARAGSMFREVKQVSVEQGCTLLTGMLNEWTDELHIPKLGAYGITGSDFDKIIAATGNKNNPARFDEDGMREILEIRL